MKTYTAAVIGLSEISQARSPRPAALAGVEPMPRSHVAAYAAHPRVRLVGVCDLAPAAIQRFESTWRDRHPDARVYTDYREMLAAEKPDVVSVITPDDKHADIFVHTADSGVRAIWCEKPIATTLEDADRMIAAADRNGTAVSVSHTRRWMPIYHRVRDLVRDRTYGPLRLITATMYYSRAMLFRNGTHTVDMLGFLADAPPEWVFAELEDGFDGFDRYRGDGGAAISSEPSASAYIKYASGVRACLTMVKSNNMTNVMELVFDSAVIRLGADDRIVVQRVDGPPATATRGAISVTQILGHEAWQADRELAVLSELVDALDRGAQPTLSTPRDARTTLAVLLAILESHAKGNVKVPVRVH